MPRYLSSGHLVYMRSGVLFAAPFDVTNLKVTGEPVPVSEMVGGEPSSGAAYFAVSDNGTFVYRPGHNVVADQKLVLVDRNGGVTPLPLDHNAFNTPQFSPDGRRLAYGIGSAGSGTGDIWILDLETSLSTRLTFSEASTSPVWSRDGRFVYFGSVRGRGQGIYRKAHDGTGDDELVYLMSEVSSPTGIGPEGKTILSTAYSPAVQIVRLRLQEGGRGETGGIRFRRRLSLGGSLFTELSLDCLHFGWDRQKRGVR